MTSLWLGVLAALAWGGHDLCVRFVTRKTAALAAFLVVLAMGLPILAVLSIGLGNWAAMTGPAYGLAGLAGLGYVLGGIGLYQAFTIGPVKLVAPVLGAFPILSVSWAAVQGEAVTAGQWIAVVLIVAGVSVVALWAADAGAPEGQRRSALAWAVVGAAGFALTFGLGQAATVAGSALPVQLVARAVAFVALGGILLAIGQVCRVARGHWPMLALMGALDVLALGAVLAAGAWPRPEFAAAASSVFGLVTILLAWRFLGEPMTGGQWGGVLLVFAAMSYLAI